MQLVSSYDFWVIGTCKHNRYGVGWEKKHTLEFCIPQDLKLLHHKAKKNKNVKSAFFRFNTQMKNVFDGQGRQLGGVAIA